MLTILVLVVFLLVFLNSLAFLFLDSIFFLSISSILRLVFPLLLSYLFLFLLSFAPFPLQFFDFETLDSEIGQSSFPTFSISFSVSVTITITVSVSFSRSSRVTCSRGTPFSVVATWR